MAPQTRSTKPSPGRATRNSIFGRPPPPPPKPRNSLSGKSPVRAAHETEVQGQLTSDISDTKGTPWLACRDAHGVMTTVALSETGEGIHVRWYYPEDDCEIDEDEDEDANADAGTEMTVDEERGVTPPTTAGPRFAVRRPFPQTPIAPHPYDAGSVILTPVKKARPLQRSPPRIGDKGIRCLYEKGGVLREFNGGARVVLRHAVGSTMNLSREQVEGLEKQQEDKIIQIQVEKLLAQKQLVEEEEQQFSDSGYEDEMETDVPSPQRDLRRHGTDETSLVSHSELSDITLPDSLEMDHVLGFFRGANGELLDDHGRQMFGPEGTTLIDTTDSLPRRIMREEAFIVTTDTNRCASEVKGLRRARFGPEGTELID